MSLCTSLLALAILAPQETPEPAPEDQAEEQLHVRTVSVDANGRVAVAESDGNVRFLDGATGEHLWKIDPVPPQKMWCLEFSPDGTRLAGLMVNGGLRIWKLDERARKAHSLGDLARSALPGSKHWTDQFGGKLLWSPKGNALVAGDQLGNTSLWTADGEGIHSWKVNEPYPDSEFTPIGAAQLAWNPDGSLLYTAHLNTVQIRDARTGELRLKEAGVGEIDCGEGVISIAVHPADAVVATGHVGVKLRTWNLETGELLREASFPDSFLPEATDSIAAIEFEPRGERIAFSTFDGTFVHVIDVATFDSVWKSEHLGAHFFERMPIRWSPDSSHLWYAYDCRGGSLYCVEPAPGEEPREITHSFLPSFGGGIGVVPEYTGAFAIQFDGERHWPANEAVGEERER